MRSANDTRSALESTLTAAPLKCVWMLAGNVDYKLCDREYDCDECPFDLAIRGCASRKLEWAVSRESPGPRQLRESTSTDH